MRFGLKTRERDREKKPCGFTKGNELAVLPCLATKQMMLQQLSPEMLKQ